MIQNGLKITVKPSRKQIDDAVQKLLKAYRLHLDRNWAKDKRIDAKANFVETAGELKYLLDKLYD